MKSEATKRELIERAGQLLGDRFREDFSPSEAVGVLAATLERILGWLDHDDALLVIADFRAALDQCQQQRSALH